MAQDYEHAIRESTVSGLPSSTRTDRPYFITDADSVGDVSTGGGAIRGLTYFDGTNFVWIAASLDFFAYQNAIFAAFDSAGGTDLGTSFTAITWDTEIRKDANYTHSADSSDITVSAAGTYRVTVNITADNDSTTRFHADWRIFNVTDAIEEPGTRRGSYHRTTGDDVGSATINILLTLNASDVIRVEGQTDDTGTDVQTLADGCSIEIVRIA